MAIQYYPRIDESVALKLAAELVSASVEDAGKMAKPQHDHQYYYATASLFAAEDELWELRQNALRIATDLGFPNPSGSNQRRQFDQSISALLFNELELIPAEAANHEVWSFITLVLLPDLAKWRYPNRARKVSYNRWLGHDRNVFRKLWWREATLGHALNSVLGEDEAVGIMERTLLGGQSPVARAMVRALLVMENEFPNEPRSELMRAGAVNLRRYAPFTAFEFYSEEQMNEFVLDIFRSSSQSYTLRHNLEKQVV